MTSPRQIPKHTPPEDVDILYARLSKKKKSLTQLSRDLGISRTTLHLMFKHELGMRKVYAIAIGAILED